MIKLLKRCYNTYTIWVARRIKLNVMLYLRGTTLAADWCSIIPLFNSEGKCASSCVLLIICLYNCSTYNVTLVLLITLIFTYLSPSLYCKLLKARPCVLSTSASSDAIPCSGRLTQYKTAEWMNEWMNGGVGTESVRSSDVDSGCPHSALTAAAPRVPTMPVSWGSAPGTQPSGKAWALRRLRQPSPKGPTPLTWSPSIRWEAARSLAGSPP